MTPMQRLLRVVYPPHCLICSTVVEGENGLCGPCWRDTPFIVGAVCDLCGAPLPGEEDDDASYCDECLTIARPWARGRAALIYRDNGRRLVLSLKHGDRTDLAIPAAAWMQRALAPILEPDLLVAPIPLHRFRLLRRRYNQAALLAENLAQRVGLDYCPDLLLRPSATPQLKGRGIDARFAALSAAIKPHPRRLDRLRGRKVLLVDDVMTSGATLGVAAEACLAAGAQEVRVVTLARAVRDD